MRKRQRGGREGKKRQERGSGKRGEERNGVRERREREKWRRERREREKWRRGKKEKRKVELNTGQWLSGMVRWNGLCDLVSNSIHTGNRICSHHES